MTYKLEDTKKWLETIVKIAKEAPENARLLRIWTEAISNENKVFRFTNLNTILHHLFSTRHDRFTNSFLFYMDSDIVDDLVRFFDTGQTAKVWRIRYARDLMMYEGEARVTTTPLFNTIREIFDSVKEQSPGPYACIVKARVEDGKFADGPISVMEFNGKTDFWLKMSKILTESSPLFCSTKVPQELASRYLSVRRHIYLADLKLSEFED